MRHKPNEIDPASDRITELAVDVAGAVAERSRLNKELLIVLANAVGRNGERQRKFRYVVINGLAKIGMLAKMVHGAQIAELHGSRPGSDEARREHGEDADRLIEEQSGTLGLKMVRYVYSESEEPAPPRGGWRRWSNWEI